jgi:putative PIG3 family NAD(P)H quinone oxidoreductase
MRYINVSAPGGPDRLVLMDGPSPEPGPDDVLIRVAAAGVNRADVLQREGRYPPPPGASAVLGLELAGTIERCGAAVTEWSPGDHVCALVAGGAYAELCVVPAVQCLPVPRGMSLIEAAALPEATFTVWDNLFRRAHLAPGETVLIHGGSSGIGTFAIQLAHVLGARVLTTAGSAAKCDACVRLGAAAAINYRELDFVAEALRLTEDRGVDVVLDIVGGSYVARNMRVLAVEGRLVQIGLQEGSWVELDLHPIMRQRLTITGSTLRWRSAEQKGAIAREVRERVWPLLDAGRVRPVIDHVFPLAAAAEAHRRMESGEHIGKIVLVV